jgi:hypothetical protein
VVIAAGTFGSLDLMNRLNSRFTASPMLGQRMSMNGDGLAFLYNTRFRRRPSRRAHFHRSASPLSTPRARRAH